MEPLSHLIDYGEYKNSACTLRINKLTPELSPCLIAIKNSNRKNRPLVKNSSSFLEMLLIVVRFQKQYTANFGTYVKIHLYTIQPQDETTPFSETRVPISSSNWRIEARLLKAWHTTTIKLMIILNVWRLLIQIS